MQNISWFGQPWGGDVLISSFLKPFTGGQGQGVSLWAEHRLFSLIFRQRGRVPRGRPLCVPIVIDNILLVIIVTKAMASKGLSKRNRSNMESDFVLPCYNMSVYKYWMHVYGTWISKLIIWTWVLNIWLRVCVIWMCE